MWVPDENKDSIFQLKSFFISRARENEIKIIFISKRMVLSLERDPAFCDNALCFVIILEENKDPMHFGETPSGLVGRLKIPIEI